MGKLRETLSSLFRSSKPIKVDSDFYASLESASIQDIINLLVSLRQLAVTYSEKLNDYRRMAADSVVGAAINLIAEDACQVDFGSQRSLWVEPANDSVKALEACRWLNGFIKVCGIEDLMWTVAFNVVRDGGCYLRTNECELSALSKEDRRSSTLRSKLGYHFTVVDDYETVSELSNYGDVVGYYVEDPKKTIVYPKTEFIHFINDRRVEKNTVTLKLGRMDSDSVEKETEFTIRRGLSLIEDARRAFRVLEVLEMVLVAVRVGRSQLYRLVNIEVGNADKNETAKLLRDFKAKLSTQESLDVENGSYAASLKPVPHGKNIYIPTRSGKGQVSMNLVGGDYNLREIVDIDYFKNKLYAGLQIPKAYLGLEESLPGGIGDTSLTRLDIRYARRVKRVKAILEKGFQDLLEYHCTKVGKTEWKNQFTVKTANLITAEENDRYESIKSRAEFVDAVGTLFSDVPGFSKRKFAALASRDILGLADIYDKVVDESVPDDGSDDSDYNPMGVEGNLDAVSPAGDGAGDPGSSSIPSEPPSPEPEQPSGEEDAGL